MLDLTRVAVDLSQKSHLLRSDGSGALINAEGIYPHVCDGRLMFDHETVRGHHGRAH